MQYEGINALCFSCGCVGHKTKGCPYVMKPLEHAEKPMGENDVAGSHRVGKDHVVPDCDDFEPWVFVTRNRKPRKNLSKVEKSLTQVDISVSKPSQPTNFLSLTKETMRSDLGANMEFQHHCDLTKESNLRVDRTNSSFSREKPTFKQKSQKEKNPKCGQQQKKNQAETDGTKAFGQKNFLRVESCQVEPFQVKLHHQSWF